MRQLPFDETTVEVSFRVYKHGHSCAYVNCVVDERGGQRRLVDTAHITGKPEELFDQAMQRARSLALEHWLSAQEPF